MTSALHIAAMPFPSVQGTQAAVRAMIEVEHDAGRTPALLTYAHAGYELDVRWPVHRIADLTRDRSLRSGPSWRKVVQDGQLVLKARAVHRELSPRVTVAHHVEAASAALAARLSPVLFVVHTALGPELPTYLPERAKREGSRLGALAARAGSALDVGLAKRAHAAAAIAPWLVDHLSERGVRVDYLPIPWRIPEPIAKEERVKARTRLRLEPHDAVLLYAGNLDAYQGVTDLVRAFAIVHAQRPNARLLLATESDPDAIERELFESGLQRSVRFAPLSDEPDRRVVHAAADLAWIPRAAPGGLPIKLLDSLARGVPTVVTRRATAGLSLFTAATVTADDDPEALAAAALLMTEARESSRELGQRGTEYMAREHTDARYLEALDRITARL